MKDKRKIGVLCHVTSLPSKYGIGDLGQECFKFIDFLKDNNFNVWEILPLNKINDFNCPYGTISAFAFEELLIDLQPFIDNGVLTKKEPTLFDSFKCVSESTYPNYLFCLKELRIIRPHVVQIVY